MDKVPVTVDGFARLKEELKHLKEIERPRISQEIGIAREHGDLRENAEYHAAREKQGFIEGRIGEIETAIALAEVIDTSSLVSDKVAFGAKVKLSNSDSGEEVEYRIVGAAEADPKKGSISITSPIARALIGRSVGDEAKVTTPGGGRVFEILEVSYR